MGKNFYKVDIKYNFWLDFLEKHVGSIILVAVAGFIVPKDIVKYYILIVVLYAIWILISSIYNRKKINSTQLSIYEDKLVYEINFLKQERREIFYNEISDLKYTQRQISNMFNIGELFIVVRDKSFFNNILTIKGINNYKEVIEQLEKTITEYGKKNNMIREENN